MDERKKKNPLLTDACDTKLKVTSTLTHLTQSTQYFRKMICDVISSPVSQTVSLSLQLQIV
jgi:hypothetical protein